MKEYRININYAKALFMLASDLKEEERVMDDMRLVNDVCRENHLLNVVLDNPTLQEAKKVGIVKSLFGGHVSNTTLAFLEFVTRKRRTVYLKGISDAYMAFYRDSRNIVLSEVKTADYMSDEVYEGIRNKVAAYSGKKVELVKVLDSNMLGGACITFDNNMYDARLRTKIAQLRKEFSKNVYEKKL
ncbi:MAG: ATP synthase F1 subunit delta [Bacteroidales bacterium]|nr:ATP synthase F1 subunit delta [Bacteroidales bacterium]